MTKAGQANLELNSGKMAVGTCDLTFSMRSIWFFSIKKTGILFFESTLLAKAVNL